MFVRNLIPIDRLAFKGLEKHQRRWKTVISMRNKSFIATDHLYGWRKEIKMTWNKHFLTQRNPGKY